MTDQKRSVTAAATSPVKLRAKKDGQMISLSGVSMRQLMTILTVLSKLLSSEAAEKIARNILNAQPGAYKERIRALGEKLIRLAGGVRDDE